MRLLLITFILAVTSLGLMHCGDDDDDSSAALAGGCDFNFVGTEGLTYCAQGVTEAACTETGSSEAITSSAYQASGCDTDSSVGSCADGDEPTIYYVGENWTEALAQEDCEDDDGTFTAAE